ncbi:hypothetical protein AB0P12_00455 [Streptomyces subrutilus]|uniref:hypothetical protein n=1 Tax=Streptomyces subrutilus TaxID=36818 RepID=UPI0033D039B1
MSESEQERSAQERPGRAGPAPAGAMPASTLGPLARLADGVVELRKRGEITTVREGAAAGSAVAWDAVSDGAREVAAARRAVDEAERPPA